MSYSYAQLLSSPRVAQPTCEGNAALAEWNEHAAAVNTPRDLIVQASDLPDRADPRAVVNAFNACAADADAMTRLYHAAAPRPRGLADVLAWMRPWFERQRQPIPDAIDDGFRTLAGALGRPNILRQDRIAIYQEAAVFATRESELAAELGGDVQRQTDATVRAAHTAALEAARAVENGRAQPDPAAAIAAAAGPGHPAVAQEQTRQLSRSLAAHPDQDGYTAQTRRALAAIPDAFLWIGGIALFAVAVGFRPLAVRLGTAGAVEFPLLLLVTLPLSWLPLALLHAVTGWPNGWIALVLWLAVIGLLLMCGPRFLPGHFRDVWSSVFASPPLSTHGSAHFGRAQDAAAHLRPAAPDDAFALGGLRDAPRDTNRRFRQDGHILTCAPTGAGKGIGAVIPNLLDYPGSAFVLDLKGENYAVTAHARRAGRLPDLPVRHYRRRRPCDELARCARTGRSGGGQSLRRSCRHAGRTRRDRERPALERQRPGIIARPPGLCRRLAIRVPQHGRAAPYPDCPRG
jgi:hypothetical protein